MNQDDVIAEFVDAEAMLKGHFILSSGLHSDTYLQCARVLMDAQRADRLCKALANKITAQLGENAFDIVVAPAMGGVVVGYEMGRQLALPSIFCERVAGGFALRRGFDIKKGQRVLVLEDVVTTGKSSLEAYECIHIHDGEIIAEACLVDRSAGKVNLGVPLIALMELEVASYEPDHLPDHLKEIDAVKPGSRWLKA
jgi:orotate phosphoribosyltransferase